MYIPQTEEEEKNAKQFLVRVQCPHRHAFNCYLEDLNITTQFTRAQIIGRISELLLSENVEATLPKHQLQAYNDFKSWFNGRYQHLTPEIIADAYIYNNNIRCALECLQFTVENSHEVRSTSVRLFQIRDMPSLQAELEKRYNESFSLVSLVKKTRENLLPTSSEQETAKAVLRNYLRDYCLPQVFETNEEIREIALLYRIREKLTLALQKLKTDYQSSSNGIGGLLFGVRSKAVKIHLIEKLLGSDAAKLFSSEATSAMEIIFSGTVFKRELMKACNEGLSENDYDKISEDNDLKNILFDVYTSTEYQAELESIDENRRYHLLEIEQSF